mmetsp:Transcript_12379/g.19060  ORF Transcript_12379/g.19060 Transcript_12379/m.19060 type:complete len:108 (+) Transcript_12379:760-1083(+)
MQIQCFFFPFEISAPRCKVQTRSRIAAVANQTVTLPTILMAVATTKGPSDATDEAPNTLEKHPGAFCSCAMTGNEGQSACAIPPAMIAATSVREQSLVRVPLLFGMA